MCYKRFIISILPFILILFSLTGIGQQANIWYFGENAGLNFNTTPTSAITDNNKMVSNNGSAILCDSNGDLLMYTNGETIWDARHNVIRNGDNLTCPDIGLHK